MYFGRTHTIRALLNPRSTFDRVLLVGLVAFFGYFTARLGDALVLRPQMVWPLWPGCALLIAILLMLPQKMWPLIMAAGFTGFIVYDLQLGLSLRTTALLILADTVEVLIAALGVSYSFNDLPRLDSINALARFSLLPLFSLHSGQHLSPWLPLVRSRGSVGELVSLPKP